MKWSVHIEAWGTLAINIIITIISKRVAAYLLEWTDLAPVKWGQLLDYGMQSVEMFCLVLHSVKAGRWKPSVAPHAVLGLNNVLQSSCSSIQQKHWEKCRQMEMQSALISQL